MQTTQILGSAVTASPHMRKYVVIVNQLLYKYAVAHAPCMC